MFTLTLSSEQPVACLAVTPPTS